MDRPRHYFFPRACLAQDESGPPAFTDALDELIYLANSGGLSDEDMSRAIEVRVHGPGFLKRHIGVKKGERQLYVDLRCLYTTTSGT